MCRSESKSRLGRGSVCVVVLSAVAVAAFAQEPEIDWKRAEREIVRLPPSAFTRVPAGIRNELQRRRCTIPQVWPALETNPRNIEPGHFTSANATEWIALCSVNGASSILVLHHGGVTARLAKGRDAAFLQGRMPGKAGFSRRIRAISADEIRTYCKLWQQKCPQIEHDGIEDIFEDKASSIEYFTRGKWIALPGAD